ncbi:sodium:neurotransmitter symporter family protein [Leptospira borgpetersenii]|uniref:sodium-dependent transporter n=1 Tax=Leptospira borgpetersenii TaxID=174 RepID=UPI0007741904|nr:sodium-dependent transporter [Leptospira borgpetersenii]MBE8363980.1 sodium-dependent transporter [Leptospira borgpetersenii serovar Balcanica]MBE8367436.1 sodium-dependent transporter [Leptospira borgpetersenii serovar Balcanica]MBE8398784.1 sodium-dependent transporter [Leptospira borgpetersenii serovar Tarassovi]MBE8401795.1 sodium-dependent transporter [Leptospira borgpetersenii serovar Tarassovi]MBE8405220.1 sodium-dependent transporter [Leptospira borgpetersenii serovar Tarassovi]
MSKEPPKENWKSRTGLILTVASGAIGLGNFIRFPGQAVANGGGAFMVPYIISFILVGIPVCITEWIMGRMGGRTGHSAPFLFKSFLSGFPLRIVGAIGITIPILIYIYYVFIEAWCLAYSFEFLTGQIRLNPNGNAYQSQIIEAAGNYYLDITGARANGDAISGKIFYTTLTCFILNFALVYRGISKGIETFAKIAVPLMLVCSAVILVRVLTLDNIEIGLGKMWNPDWSALLKSEVWIAAAGQIFFTLSAGFGIALVFSSYLKRDNDVVLSSLSAASLNEFVEVAIGGMITIPVSFLFLGASINDFGTFGMGFIALPSVFSLMPGGEWFGAIWFFVLFLAAITSSVTMLQPGIIFLEESFGIRRHTSTFILFVFTGCLCFPILYFNQNFQALELADFWVGTILIFILASIQIFLFGWKIGAKKGIEDGNEGSHFELPRFFWFVIQYITPVFLIVVFIAFLIQNLPGHFERMSVDAMISQAIARGTSVEAARTKALVSKSVFFGILIVFSLIVLLVHYALKYKEKRVNLR